MTKEFDTICTERLLLRGIDETDAGIIVLFRSDPEVYRFFKSPHQITLEEHLDWYNKRYMTDCNRYDWICIEQASGTKIGVFGLYKNDENKAEINYLLASDAQHKGYAAEAIHALLKYAWQKWHIKQIIAEIHEENSPSIRLAEHLGFKLVSQKKPFRIYMIEADKQ